MNESDLLTLAPILIVVLGTLIVTARAVVRRDTPPPEPTARRPATAQADRSLPGCLRWWILVFAALICLDVAWMVLAQSPDDCREWCELPQVVGGWLLGLLILIGSVGWLVTMALAKVWQARRGGNHPQDGSSPG